MQRPVQSIVRVSRSYSGRQLSRSSSMLLSAGSCHVEPTTEIVREQVSSSGKRVVQPRTYVPGPDKPVLGPLHSEKVFLNQGEEVWWCSCGRSKTPPFCDGAHEGLPAFEPVKFVAPETKMYSFCLCRYTNKQPLCDGEHKGFPGWTPKGKPALSPSSSASSSTSSQAGGASGTATSSSSDSKPE